MTTNVATFLRRCALAHLSEDPDEAANAMEGVVDMAVDALPDFKPEHSDVAALSKHIRNNTPSCCSPNVTTTKRTSATASFVAVTCSDSEDEADAMSPQSAGTVD